MNEEKDKQTETAEPENSPEEVKEETAAPEESKSDKKEEKKEKRFGKKKDEERARRVNEELAIVEQYEPKMYKACMNIFGKSYEYTKKYRAFQAEMKAREKAGYQLMLTELVERME